MADAVFDGSFVLHVDDDDGRTLVGFAPGPAGMAVIDLGQGMSLAVDFADPATLVSCRADRWLRDDVLEVLIGARAAHQVSKVRQSDRPVRISDGSDAEREFNRNLSEPPDNPVALAYGTCAVLSSIIDDEQQHELARASAALELADNIATLALPTDIIDDIADRTRQRAIELLTDSIDALEALADNDPRTARQLRSLLNQVMKDHGADDLRWRQIFTEFERTIRRTHPSTKAAAAPARAMPMRLPMPMRTTEAEVRVPERTVVDLKPNGLLVVHRPFTTDDETAWARVLQQPQLTLVAAAPLLRTRTRLRAELLVPPDLTLDQLIVEVTNDPLPTSSSLDTIRRAIDLGRRAASLETLHSPQAPDAWQACAAAWTALDDPRRAQLARQHSTSSARVRPASIAERVAHAIGAA